MHQLALLQRRLPAAARPCLPVRPAWTSQRRWSRRSLSSSYVRQIFVPIRRYDCSFFFCFRMSYLRLYTHLNLCDSFKKLAIIIFLNCIFISSYRFTFYSSCFIFSFIFAFIQKPVCKTKTPLNRVQRYPFCVSLVLPTSPLLGGGLIFVINISSFFYKAKHHLRWVQQ